jgi:hypothetical protein
MPLLPITTFWVNEENAGAVIKTAAIIIESKHVVKDLVDVRSLNLTTLLCPWL